jgi:hypothetical protein
MAQTCFGGEALDIAIGQAANVGADNERFEGSGPDRSAAVGDDRTHEAGQAVADLRHSDRDRSFRGLNLLRSVAVARAAGVGRAFEASSAQKPLDLFLDRSLEYELGSGAAESAQPFETVDIGPVFEAVE